MTSERQIQTLTGLLFKPPEAEDSVQVSVFALLDGATVPGLTERLDASDIEACCLYRGDLDADTALRAPYMVQFTGPADPFLRWILEELGDRPWGVFATTVQTVSFDAVRRHFRRFLKVKSPDGETWLFRYYDPRVLRVYLPTCQPEEWEYVFGPMGYFYAGTSEVGRYERFSYTARTGFAKEDVDLT